MLPRNALDNPPRCYRALLGTCRIRNALVALLLTVLVGLPVEGLCEPNGGRYLQVGANWWYIGCSDKQPEDRAQGNTVWWMPPIPTQHTYKAVAGGFSDNGVDVNPNDATSGTKWASNKPT